MGKNEAAYSYKERFMDDPKHNNHFIMKLMRGYLFYFILLIMTKESK
jgi:hypothetical protein